MAIYTPQMILHQALHVLLNLPLVHILPQLLHRTPDNETQRSPIRHLVFILSRYTERSKKAGAVY